jgi:hypothetical protein
MRRYVAWNIDIVIKYTGSKSRFSWTLSVLYSCAVYIGIKCRKFIAWRISDQR